MKLNISYARPCSEKDTLIGRIDLNETVDRDKIREKFSTSGSDFLKLRMDGKEVIIYSNHIDIRNAQKEHEILKIVQELKPFLKGTS